MIFYLDTSLIIAALTPEARTGHIQDWLVAQDAGTLAVSGWVVTEVSSALSIKIRTGALSLDDRAAALAAWHRLLDDSLEMETIQAKQYAMAASYTDRHELGLRAGDALHLAVAFDQGMTLATLDKTLAEAGQQVGAMTSLL